jgi:hypothetical protein
MKNLLCFCATIQAYREHKSPRYPMLPETSSADKSENPCWNEGLTDQERDRSDWKKGKYLTEKVFLIHPGLEMCPWHV